jgi:1-deoxy-D-xylulose-5-phosphate reductoisomerase
MGAAGLEPTLAAIEVGSNLAIANKETLVCAGGIIMPAASQAGLPVLPVDSEHSGIFQCMLAGRRGEIRRVTITSSGGSLRDWPDDQAHEATVAEALAHPTWQMGQKITIDSATLMNKTLEIIEAHWLFGLAAEQIEVVVHPQSIVHAMVEFCDGSVIAQLAMPDMKGPIAYALEYPLRPARDTKPLDLSSIANLDFRPLTERGLRAVSLAYEVIRLGGASGAILNAANEAAVEAFLAGAIKFGHIVPLVENTLHRWVDSQKTAPTKSNIPGVTLEQIRQADAWAREQIRQAGR